MPRTRSPGRPREPWLAITLLAAFIAILTAEWFTPRAHTPMTLGPLVLNVLVFCALTWLVVAVTNRTIFSIALVTSFLAFLVLCNRLKLRYLETPIHPADLFALRNVFLTHLFSRSAVVIGSAIALVLLAGLANLMLVRRLQPTVTGRVAAAAFSAVFLVSLATASRSAAVSDFLRARGVAAYTPSASIELEYNGLLLNLLLHASDLQVPVPAGYDEAAIRRVVEDLAPEPPLRAAPGEGPVNLVIFVVEAMMDPADLGWRMTADPMPFFHGLRSRFSSGWAYSPEVGGRSANPEFELLSGLATYYLPRESVPYLRFVNRALPALPRFFSERGYHSSALHVDSLAFFNYVEVYRDFGFSEVQTLRNDTSLPLDAAGRVPSDEALVDLVINVGRQTKPYFLFAFTNGTHLPYDYPAYLGSTLDIVDPMPPDARREVKTYINALRAADQAIAKLIRFYEESNDRVVIAILGDHLPGLSLEGMSRSVILRAKNVADGMGLSHRCPVVLWSNRPAEKRDFELSFNFLGQRILAEMGIAPTGVWRSNAAMASRYPVLSKFVQTSDGRRFLPENVPASDLARVNDYGLVQYDVLFGSQYSLRTESPP